jgi:AAA+ superfamily predicted ATPase
MKPGLDAELRWLDGLLHREVGRVRALYELSVDEFRGIYVSDEQVDAHLAAGPPETPAPGPLPDPQPGTAWAAVCGRLRLAPVERGVLVLALAPELDRKYEALFAYLNNEVTRRWPTVDLAIRLLGDARGARAALLEEGRLLASGLIEGAEEGPGRRSSLARAFAAGPALTRFVLALPPELPAGCFWTDAPSDNALPAELAAVADRLREDGTIPPPALALAGPAGTGRRRAAHALAGRLGRPLLTVDLATGEDAPRTLRRAALTARLTRAVLLVAGLDGLAPENGPAQARLGGALAALPCPTLLALDPGGAPCPALDELALWRVELPQPDAAGQRRLWERALADAGIPAPSGHAQVLAERFRLDPERIARAGRTAAFAAGLDGSAGQEIPLPLLCRAAREQSGSALRRLASAVPCRYGWDDLVLPPATIDRVRAVADAIAHRSRVQEDWGMARHSGGGGLVALFQGTSGTGKTMTSGVIATELGLELCRVDLAGVVSKYIGETEKNLDRIFRAARRSNAVLLFDEADALFGKRSEVKDAHDRYANLEVAYLLQRMEEHDGPMILATNLSRNMDQAFSRRLHQIVEFPRPDAPARERLWRRMLRPPLPCADDVDPGWLALTFDLTGGEIRKAALEAAYLAAAAGSAVTMEFLATTAARESRRQGRLAGLAGGREVA